MSIIVLDCKLEEIKNPHENSVAISEYERGKYVGIRQGIKLVLSHAHEIDIDALAERWHYKREDRWDYENTPEGELPIVRFDMSFSQFLESQIKTDTEKKK